MWVHLLDNWEEALDHCARVQAEVERQLMGCTSTKTATMDVEKLEFHEIYTMLIDVCLNPMEPIAIGIILPNTSLPFFTYFL